MKSISFLILISFLIFSSCKKESADPYNSNVKAPLSVEFDNIVGGLDLKLNSGSYTNAVGESFTVTKLKYYVSNFVLTNTDGSTYTVPQSECYFLMDESDGTAHEATLQVPEGEYKTLRFIVGIDSIKNTSDVASRTGVLDPSGTGADMYWGWNSGYIFFKMEGTSSSSPAAGKTFFYHIGGFGGYSSKTINNIQTITLDLSARGVPQVKQGKETNIHLFVDVMKVFNGTTNVSIAQYPDVMFAPYSTTLSSNYAKMFTHDHTEN